MGLRTPSVTSSLRGLAGAAFAGALLSGCAPAATEGGAEEDVEARVEAESSMLLAAAGGVTVRVDPVARFADRDGVRMVVLRASASRDLTGVFSFVPDDAFGQATLLTKRTFEVQLRTDHELNSILSGLPLLVRLDVKNGSTPTVFAQVSLAPAFARFSGSGAVFVEEAVRPVFLRDEIQLAYRGAVRTSSPATAMAISTTDGVVPTITRTGASSFDLDLRFDGLVQVVDPASDRVRFEATLESGATRTKAAALQVVTSGLQATTLDPYDAWPTASCDRAVWDCVQAGDVDLGHCGSYREVQRCVGLDLCAFEPCDDGGVEG